MIRINRLLRAAKSISKVPARAGPGWDRPDVPPTHRVETDRRVILLSFSGLICKSSILFSTLPCQNFSSPNLKFMKELFTTHFLNLPQFGAFYLEQLSHYIYSIN